MKKTLIIASTVLTLTLSGLGFTSPPAEAAESVSENNKKISKIESKIIISSKKVNEINLDIDVLKNALEENNKEIKKITKKVEKFETDIKKTKEEIEALEIEIEERNEILKERLSSYQNDGGEFGFMEVIFGSVSFDEFISRYTAVTAITTADNELVEIQKEAIEEVETKQKEVEEKLAKTKETKVELDKVNKVKKDQKADLTVSKKAAKKEVSKLKEQKAEYVAKGNDLAAIEARVEEEVNTNNTTEQVVQTSAETDTEEQTEAVEQVSASTESTSIESTESSESTSTESTESSESTNDSKKEKTEKSATNLGSGSNGSALSAAHSQTGTRYTTAGKNPSSGFDCSGFVSWAYGQEGVSLPSYTGALASKGQSVPSLAQAKAGDLVFFRGGAHVGIYVGGGKFIGSQTSTGVAVADMNSGYWKDTFDGKIRRVK